MECGVTFSVNCFTSFHADPRNSKLPEAGSKTFPKALSEHGEGSRQKRKPKHAPSTEYIQLPVQKKETCMYALAYNMLLHPVYHYPLILMKSNFLTRIVNLFHYELHIFLFTHIYYIPHCSRLFNIRLTF